MTLALASKVNDYVSFPKTANERDKIKHDLFCVGGFPSAIDCIDGTHVRIKAPHRMSQILSTEKAFIQ